MTRYIYEITENANNIGELSADVLSEQQSGSEFKDMEGPERNELRIAFIARFAALGCSTPVEARSLKLETTGWLHSLKKVSLESTHAADAVGKKPQRCSGGSLVEPSNRKLVSTK